MAMSPHSTSEASAGSGPRNRSPPKVTFFYATVYDMNDEAANIIIDRFRNDAADLGCECIYNRDDMMFQIKGPSKQGMEATLRLEKVVQVFVAEEFERCGESQGAVQRIRRVVDSVLVESDSEHYTSKHQRTTKPGAKAGTSATAHVLDPNNKTVWNLSIQPNQNSVASDDSLETANSSDDGGSTAFEQHVLEPGRYANYNFNIRFQKLRRAANSALRRTLLDVSHVDLIESCPDALVTRLQVPNQSHHKYSLLEMNREEINHADFKPPSMFEKHLGPLPWPGIGMLIEMDEVQKDVSTKAHSIYAQRSTADDSTASDGTVSNVVKDTKPTTAARDASISTEQTPCAVREDVSDAKYASSKIALAGSSEQGEKIKQEVIKELLKIPDKAENSDACGLPTKFKVLLDVMTIAFKARGEKLLPRCDFGQIMCIFTDKDIVKDTRKQVCDLSKWKSILDSYHRKGMMSTEFTNRLTTMEHEIDFLVSLHTRLGGNLFETQSRANYMSFEIHCIDDIDREWHIEYVPGSAPCTRLPSKVQAVVYCHHATRAWDARFVVEQAEFGPGVPGLYEIENSLRLDDDLSFTKEDTDLRVTRVTLRRRLRFPALLHAGILLEVTEHLVLPLFVDGAKYRASVAKPRAAAAQDHDLWYTASLVPDLEQVQAAVEEKGFSVAAGGSNNKMVNQEMLQLLYALAGEVVHRINNIGASNRGPCV